MEEYCIMNLYVQSPLPRPILLAVRHVLRQRTLRRQRGRVINIRQNKAEVSYDLTDLDGPNVVRKSLVVRQPRNSQASFWCL